MVLVEQRRRVKAKPALTLRHSDANQQIRTCNFVRNEESLPAVEHAPVPVGVLGPVQFRRCRCGFTLAKYDGKVFWIRAKPGIREILNPEGLARALRTRCWHYRRKMKSSNKAPTSVASSNSARTQCRCW
jgi:hypothetical protein